MKMKLSTLLLLLGLFAFGYAKKCPTRRTSPGKEILCYTASNNAEDLSEIICKCTTLVHQGHQLQNLSISGVEELRKTLTEMNPALQVVVSVTDPQETLRTSGTTRQEASGRLADILSKVDGVELDMNAGSKERLSHFIKGLKDEMIRKSNEKRIILALPTKAEKLAKHYDLKTLAKYADLFTLSTHYLVDDTESFNTFHPSRLMGIFDMLNTDSLVDLVSGMGVPKKKLLVSVPASAYKFTLKDEKKNVPGSSVKEEEPTAVDQKELCKLMSSGEWTVERDEDLTAPYAFKDSTWIAYEDKTSVGIKGKYVLLRELAGLGVHDVENDAKNDCGKPITHEVYGSFTDMKRKTRGAVLASLENDLQHTQFPQSRHVKSSGYRIVRIVDTAGAIHAIRENTQTEFICTRQGYFVHPKSCNRFYRCVKFDQGVDDFSVFEFDCPAGLAFDERTEVCVWPGSITEGSPCPGSSEIAPVPRARFQCPGRNGYYADPQNCRWFFACFDLGEPEMMAYEFRCPFGLVFDEQKLICEWPWLVPGCGGSGSGYSRTEYGGSGSGYGSGSGHGSLAGGIGFGDHSGSGIGIGQSGQYASGVGEDSSLYQGSKASESRQTETGAGAGGIQFGGFGAGAGAGAGGNKFSGLGAGAGADGIKFSGVGFGAGAGAGGNKFSGLGAGADGIQFSGVGAGGGAGGNKFSGLGAGADRIKFSGLGFGAGAGGNKFSGLGAGADGIQFSGVGAGAGGNKFSGLGAGADGIQFSGVGAGAGGNKFSGLGAGADGIQFSGVGAGAGENKLSGLGAGADGIQFSGLGVGGNQFGNSGQGVRGSSAISGLSGSSNLGAGNGALINAGLGGIGVSGSGGSKYGYDGAIIRGQSGSAGSLNGLNAGSGSGLRGSGQYGGAGYGGSSNLGIGSTNTLSSGAGSGGIKYSNQGAGAAGNLGEFEFGAKYPTSSGSGSAQSGYSGQTGSTSTYNGLGNAGVVIETQGHDSPVYTTVTSEGGHSAVGGSTGSSGSFINTAGNSGYNGFGSTATHYGGYSGANQGIEKDGITVSIQTGGSHGSASGVTASDHTANSGYYGESQDGGNKYSHGDASGVTISDHTAHSGYYGGSQAGGNTYSHGATSGVTASDHTTNSGYYSGSQTGGKTYSSGTSQGDYSGHANGGYVTSGGSTADSQDVINGGIHSGSTILTGTTGNVYSGGLATGGGSTSVTKNTLNSLDQALNVFGVKRPGTAAPGILVQTVTPGYSVTGSSVSHGIYGGSATGSAHSNDGAFVTHSAYDAGNTGSGHIIVEHGSNQNGGYVTGTSGSGTSGAAFVNSGASHQGGSTYREDGSSETVSQIGGGGVSTGTTTYHGNGGSSSSYLNSKTSSNTNTNSNADSLTVLSHGQNSGVVITGNGNEGSVYDGVNPTTPGYVIHGVTQTGYSSSAPGTFLTGNAAPNVVVTGTSSPGVIVHDTSDSGSYSGGLTLKEGSVVGSTGSVAGVTGTSTYHVNTGSSGYGVSSGNGAGFSHDQVEGEYVGSTVSGYGNKVTYVGTGASNSGHDTGYKTNEYEGNGGHGTVTFNNGYSTSKYTEDDIRGQPAYATLPDSIVSGGRIENANGGVVLGNTLAGINTYTSHGFTKTGPTKTGITTAAIGGSGSYVTNTGYSQTTVTPGSNIFEGQKSTEGYSFGSSIGNEINNLAYVTSTVSPDLSHIDTSKINLGQSSSGVSSGYEYKKPTVSFSTVSTPSPATGTYQSVVPSTVTTPSPYSNVETVYNTPSIVTSAPITAAPAVVNTYSYRKPTVVSSLGTVTGGYKYRRPTQTVVYQNSGDSVQQTTAYQQSNDVHQQYSVTPTATPIAFATGPAETYKTTLFEAAKRPISVSTVAPVYDTGYKTVVSSTATPIAVSTGEYYYSDSRFQTGSVPSTPQTAGHLDITYQQPEITFQKEYVSSTITPNTEKDGYAYRKPSKPLTYNSPSTASPSVTVYQKPTVTFQKVEYVSSTPTSFTGDGYTYEKPRKQLTYNSPTTAAPSVTIYEQPKVTVGQQVQYVSQSTIAPDFDNTYRRPSVSIRPVLNKQTNYQKGYSATSTVSSVSNSEGYDYSKPDIKFITSTTAPVIYTESQENYGGSPTRLDIPQKEITKLVGNYNRGGTKYTPHVYVDGSTGYAGSGDSGFGNKVFINTVTSKTYEATTPASVIRTDTNNGYSSSDGSYSSSSGFDSSGFKTGGSTVGVGIGSSGSSGSSGYKTGGYTSDAGFGSSGSSGFKTGGSTVGVGIGSSGSSGSSGYKTGGYTSGAGIGSSGSSGYETGGYTSGAVIGSSGSSGSSGYKTGGYTSGVGIGSTGTSGYKTGGYTSSVGIGSSGSSGYITGGYSSTPLYEVTTVKSAVEKGKGKVIVKLSDLHPLLLGKLGAQCTCKSDPFATLRGHGAKIVKSSRGDVDLAQYDESDIYVDLESDIEPNQSTALDRASPTSAPALYSSSIRTPVTAVFGISSPAPKVYRSRGRPSTAYIPVSSTPLPNTRSRGGSLYAEISSLEKGSYEASSDNVDPQYVDIPAGFVHADIPVGRSAGGRTKSGKSLGNLAGNGNAIGGAGAAFDRYGPGGLRGVDETLEGGTDCARPGLFRHPKLCNKFYACHWDEWKQKHTLHVFNCPVHLSFDTTAGACNWPSKGPACQDDNLLV